jgi:ribosomal protein S24E
LELTIVETRPNPLLKRTEYRFQVSHATTATPPRDQVRNELAKLVKVPKERVIIERMHARFGIATTEGVAATYETAEALKVVVRDHIQVRNGLKEKPVKGPAAPVAAPAETAKPAAETPAKSEAPAKS